MKKRTYCWGAVFLSTYYQLVSNPRIDILYLSNYSRHHGHSENRDVYMKTLGFSSWWCPKDRLLLQNLPRNMFLERRTHPRGRRVDLLSSFVNGMSEYLNLAARQSKSWREESRFQEPIADLQPSGAGGCGSKLLRGSALACMYVCMSYLLGSWQTS